MKQNSDTTGATLTEILPAADNTDPSIEGAARIDHVKVGQSWQTDDGESIDEPDEYAVECSCGAEFDTWQAATKHAEEQH